MKFDNIKIPISQYYHNLFSSIIVWSVIFLSWSQFWIYKKKNTLTIYQNKPNIKQKNKLMKFDSRNKSQQITVLSQFIPFNYCLVY